MSESVPVAVPVSDSTSTSDSIAAPASASAAAAAAAAAPSDSSTSESESGSAAAASGSASAVLILRAIADRVEKSCINGRVGDDTVERLNVEDGEHQNVIALLAVYQHDASLYVEGTRLLAAWAQGDWNCTQLIHEQVSAPLFSALVHFGAPLPSSSPASLITCHSIIVSRAIRCLALLTRIPNVCIALIEAGLEKHIRTIIAKSLCITDHDNAVAIITIIDHIHNQQPDKSLLVTSGLHLSLFQLISVHISSLPLVRQSLARILVGITAHPSNRSQLLKDGIEQLLVKCLSHPSHAVDNDIGRSFCVCVGNLAGDSLEHSATLYSHGFVHHVVDVMHAHPSSTAVQIAACRALRALTLRSPAPASTSTGVDSAPLATSPLSPTSAARRGLIESGVFEAVTAAMIRGDTIKEAHVHAYTEDTQHKPVLVGSLSSSAELLSLCCCILSQLCVSDAAVSLLYSLHAPQLILATLAHHGGDATVAQHATTAIAHLANNNVSRGMLVSVGAYGAIQSALSKHQHVAAVQQAGIAALIQINGFTLQQLAI